MVCMNSKDVRVDGSLDARYTTNADGVAVLGFLFKLGKKVNFTKTVLKNFNFITKCYINKYYL